MDLVNNYHQSCSSLSILLLRKREVVYLLLLGYGSLFSMSLPLRCRGLVCDCALSWSVSLTFWYVQTASKLSVCTVPICVTVISLK